MWDGSGFTQTHTHTHSHTFMLCAWLCNSPSQVGGAGESCRGREVGLPSCDGGTFGTLPAEPTFPPPRARNTALPGTASSFLAGIVSLLTLQTQNCCLALHWLHRADDVSARGREAAPAPTAASAAPAPLRCCCWPLFWSRANAAFSTTAARPAARPCRSSSGSGFEQQQRHIASAKKVG